MPKKKSTGDKSEKSSDNKEKKPKKTAKKAPKKASSSSSEENTQPQINIGLVGHVDHGKTTLVKSLSGKWTDTHSEELKRGITIRLGYADANFYHCPGADEEYVSTKEEASGDAKFLRKVSFVDAPGHESLMATMLSGATLMDGAVLMISATEKCPQPQTREHVMALQIMGIDKVIVVQNKIDLVSEEQAKAQYKQIKDFLSQTKYKNAPIIPMCAQHGINKDMLIKTIEEVIPTPDRDPKKDSIMFVARSFDINKPGAVPNDLLGGVLGGALKQGTLSVGQELTILPGHEVEERNQKVFKPITTKVVGLMTGGKKVKELHPGGSIAVLTTLDPAIVKSDTLGGAVVGTKDKMPPVWYSWKLETHLLKRVVGAKESLVVESVKKGEVLMLNVNAAATVGVVSDIDKSSCTLALKRPVCAEKGAKVTISRRLGSRFRLIGFGVIKDGKTQ